MDFVDGAAPEPSLECAASHPLGVARGAEALMPVAERFVSVNGEGPRSGKLAAFVRFAGCNLRCSYCDTRWACEPGCPAEQLSPSEIVEWVTEQGVSCVTLTGGEPLLQPALPQVVFGLLENPLPLTVEIETNGAVDVEPVHRVRVASSDSACVALTLDCKLPSSGAFECMLFDNYEHLMPQDAVKFVVGNLDDLKAAERIMREYKLTDKCQVYVSPVFGSIEPSQIVEFMKENGLADVRLQLQLHKIIWPDEERGV